MLLNSFFLHKKFLVEEETFTFLGRKAIIMVKVSPCSFIKSLPTKIYINLE